MALLSLLLACGVSLSTISAPISNVKTIDNTSQSVSMESTGNDSNTPYIPPDKRDREIYEDCYEYNDKYEDAINLCPDDYYSRDAYYSRINSMLTIDQFAVDIDIFYFTVLTDSKVSIQVLAVDDINNSYDDDDSLVVCLKCYENLEINNNDESIKNIDTKFDDNSTNIEKSYSDLSLKPGTYFLLILPQEEYSYTATLNYTINLSVEKEVGYRDENINDLRFNKGLPGAVWLSDYIPINYKSAFDLSLVANYYEDRDSNLCYKDYALDSLRNISNQKDIHMASIYLWDKDLKEYLCESVKNVYDKINVDIGETEATISEFEYKLNITEKCIKWSAIIIGIGVGILEPIPIAGEIILDVTTEVSLAVVEFIFDTIAPKRNPIFSNYKEYLNRLYGNLEAENVTEVIEIPIYYNLKTIEIGDINNSISNIIDFTPSITKFSIDNDISFNYTNYKDNVSNIKPVIYANPSDSCYCRGKIYGINNLDLSSLGASDLSFSNSYQNFIPKTTKLNFTDTAGVDVPNSIDEIGCGEYSWYSYTAISSGIYNFFNQDDNKAKIEVFKSIVTGYSTEGMIAWNSGGFVDSNGESKGFYYDHYFNKGERLYFRVRDVNYNSIKRFKLYVTDGCIPECTYVNVYEPYSDLKHKVNCPSGEIKYEPHCFSSTWTSYGKTYGYCEKCGAVICLSSGGIGFVKA